MNRRYLLGVIGAGAVAGIAGCLGDATPLDGPDGGTKTNGEGESVSPVGGAEPCPPVETAHDQAVCAHTVDPEATAVYLKPIPDRSHLGDGTPVDEITLTFHNQSSTELTFNPHSWRIWHKPDTEWGELEQDLAGDGQLTIPPASTHSWSFTEAVESIQAEPALVPGLYAAELGVPDPEYSEEWVACIALLQLDPAE